eukprot:s1223_g2.t1
MHSSRLREDPGSNELIVKRLIAQEREVVAAGQHRHLRVPEGHCWVEGDNPKLSVDSRSFGAIPAGLLEGLVLSVIWPFWRARWLDDYDGSSSKPPLLTETADERMQVMVTSKLAEGSGRAPTFETKDDEEEVLADDAGYDEDDEFDEAEVDDKDDADL